jgi:hypothetical protein
MAVDKSPRPTPITSAPGRTAAISPILPMESGSSTIAQMHTRSF